jgi:pimeloyl-ACP methyl ester carboxylesterase
LKSTLSQVYIILLLSTLTGCAGGPAYVPDTRPLDSSRLPAADVTLEIPGLGPCNDADDRRLRLNSNEPVTVLVHGCKASAGQFRSLAQVYAFHGQQAVCFSYDDRDSLVDASATLIDALDALAGRMQNRRLTLIGHSMGGLVARKALEQERPGAWRRDDIELRLLTVSAPFAGIRIAQPCGYTLTHWLSLGLVPGICRAITGDNWYEITAASPFISRPGALLPNVERFLKVVTDERGSCRRADSTGRCLESDYVFSLEEQYQPLVDNSPRVTQVEVAAGHVEIVGDKDSQPLKLLDILQRQGLLAPTRPERRAALERLLTELY